MKTIYKSEHNEKALRYLKSRGITSNELSELLCENTLIDGTGNVIGQKSDTIEYKGVTFKKVASAKVTPPPKPKRKISLASGLLWLICGLLFLKGMYSFINI